MKDSIQKNDDKISHPENNNYYLKSQLKNLAWLFIR